MAFIVKTLGSGALTSPGVSDLYTVPEPGSAIVTSVRMVNATTSTPSITLFVKPSGGTARRIAQNNFSLGIGAMLLMEDAVTLGKGDKIQLDISGTSPNVAYMVNGLERD